MFYCRRVSTHDALSPFMSDADRSAFNSTFSPSSSSANGVTSNLDEGESAVRGSTEQSAASEMFGLSGVWLLEWESVELCSCECPYIRYQRKVWITRRRGILGRKPSFLPSPRTKNRQRIYRTEQQKRRQRFRGERNLILRVSEQVLSKRHLTTAAKWVTQKAFFPPTFNQILFSVFFKDNLDIRGGK